MTGGKAKALRRCEFLHEGEHYLAELREIGPPRDPTGARRLVWVLWQGHHQATLFSYWPGESDEDMRRRFTLNVDGWVDPPSTIG